MDWIIIINNIIILNQTTNHQMTLNQPINIDLVTYINWLPSIHEIQILKSFFFFVVYLNHKQNAIGLFLEKIIHYLMICVYKIIMPY